MLIHLAAESGADAAKFQHFQAARIVSERGFNSLGGQMSHQSAWSKPVFETYQDASVPRDWSQTLQTSCEEAGIDYFSAPYDFESVDLLDPYVSLYKIGSGDISWPEILIKIAGKGKPVLLSTGASDIGDVQRAVATILAINSQLVLLQCNTNYTGSQDNLKHIHLRVLDTYRVMFPEVVLGLSDHTHGHATVLGAVALGATVVEKHFTDDVNRPGPDHGFSMSPPTWRDMVDRTRELESSLGSASKKVAENELETAVLQRRCLRASEELTKGAIITRDLIDVLRPAPVDAIDPYEMDKVIGSCLTTDMPAGEYFRWGMLEPRG
jgi:sialic acid synthase SpsE